MRYCPSCQTKYTDDTLQFCLQDGTQLRSAPDDDLTGSAPIVVFNDTETETVVKSREPQNWQESQATQIPAPPPPPVQKKSWLPIVLGTAFVMILLFGAGGFGAWLYLRNNNEVARDTNKNSARNQNSALNKNEASPSPTANASPSATETPDREENVSGNNIRETPTPAVNPGQIREEVSDIVNTWKSQTESRNISAYMNHYADTVDYYNRRGVSASFVRSDKQKAFSRYNNIELNITNMRVTPDASGETATAVFDKEWLFEGENDYSAGKVQSQLQLRKIGGRWKITSERDLKVYYTE